MHRYLACAVTSFLTCLALAACSSEVQRRKNEYPEVKRDVIHEVERICALPEPQRTEELNKVTAESGYALLCAKK